MGSQVQAANGMTAGFLVKEQPTVPQGGEASLCGWQF